MSAGTDSRLPSRSILAVAEEILEQVRQNERMSDALDAYPADRENVHVRWLSRVRGYEVTLRFDAATLDGELLEAGRIPRASRTTDRRSQSADH